MITSSQSLTARLFKALYFQNSSFANAALGSKPSPYWRAILWGRDLLSQGLGWRLGNGDQINKRTDNWLPGKTHLKLFQPQDLITHTIKPSDILYSITR